MTEKNTSIINDLLTFCSNIKTTPMHSKEELLEYFDKILPNKLIQVDVNNNEKAQYPFPEIHIVQQIEFDKRLTKEECGYLYLTANNNNHSQIAKWLLITLSTVKKWQKNIHTKLNCHNDAHAVFIGLSYSYLTNKYSAVEISFLTAIAYGYSDTEIINLLKPLDPKANLVVNELRKLIYHKLKCNNDASAVLEGIKKGLITGINQKILEFWSKLQHQKYNSYNK